MAEVFDLQDSVVGRSGTPATKESEYLPRRRKGAKEFFLRSTWRK